MLTAQELRVGNLVYFHSNNGRTFHVIEDGIDLDLIADSEYYGGIKLTAELLKQCGFIEQGLADYVLNRFKVSYDKAERRFVMFTDTMRAVIIRDFNHLQSLYYFITGEELSIEIMVMESAKK